MDLKWLKGLFSFSPQLKNATVKLLNLNININVTKNESRKTYLQANNASIYWSSLTRPEKEKLLTEIPKALDDEKVPIMDEGYDNLAQDIVENINSEPETELVNFFTGKIPSEDLYILKAAFYIKKVFDKGGDIERLKSGITSRYGRHGANICNLYSAGYFSTWIKPLYESLSKIEGFTETTFLEAYNLVVEQYPFAIFVHRGMSVKEIEDLTDSKIKICKMYGIETLSIHGIGSDNIVTISEAIEKIKEKNKLDTQIEGKGGLIVVKINIKK